MEHTNNLQRPDSQILTQKQEEPRYASETAALSLTGLLGSCKHGPDFRPQPASCRDMHSLVNTTQAECTQLSIDTPQHSKLTRSTSNLQRST